jgi:hypothetical protein
VKATLTVELFEKDPNLVVLHDTAKRAKGILIVPDAHPGSFPSRGLRRGRGLADAR